ncbi:hypothetical protein BaRGS_00021912, partial [Batillaria attramentaria]
RPSGLKWPACPSHCQACSISGATETEPDCTQHAYHPPPCRAPPFPPPPHSIGRTR